MQVEDWEDELEETVCGPINQVKGWDELWKQIKEDLKKNSKTFPISHLNQLFILSSFATLRLKGVSQITASHKIAQQWHECKGTHMVRCIVHWLDTIRFLNGFLLRSVAGVQMHIQTDTRILNCTTCQKGHSLWTATCPGIHNIFWPSHPSKETTEWTKSTALVNQTWMAMYTCQEMCLHGWTWARGHRQV